MDCLEGMKQIPDGTIDAVICDLPYGTMKGAQLDGWEGVKTDWDEIIPTDKLFAEYERVLRMNGVAILFSQEPYTNHLRGYQYKNTNFGFGYPLMWRKNHFANALIAKNAHVSYFEDISVFFKRFDTSGHHPLRDYFSAVMSYIGATSAKQINERLGHRKAEHSFYVSPKQRIKEFKEHSGMVKLYINAAQVFFDNHPNSKMREYIDNAVEWFVMSIYCKSIEDFKQRFKTDNLFGERIDCKAFVEQEFGITL